MADNDLVSGAEIADEETRFKAEMEADADWTKWLRPMGELEGLTLDDRPEDIEALLYDGTNEQDTRVFLPRGKVGLLAAAGGTGKTYAFINLALSIATGRPWLVSSHGGFAVAKPGAVLLMLGEETREEIHRRLCDTAASMGIAGERTGDVHRRVWPLSTCGMPDTALVKDYFDKGESPFTDFFVKLATSLRDRAPGPDGWTAILLDPAARFMGAEGEKDNAAATKFITALERLTRLPGGPAVLVAHHIRKTDPAKEVDINAVRGSSALVDGARWVATMGAVNDGQGGELIALNHVKNNYGPRTGKRWLERSEHGILFVTGKRPEGKAGNGTGGEGGHVKHGGHPGDADDDDPFEVQG